MARQPKPKPIGTRAPSGVDLSADTSDEREQPQTDEERLSALLGQLGSVEGYSVRIERKRTPGMQLQLAGYLGVLPLTTEFYDDVAQAWGGGSYAGRVYRGNDYKANLTFSIAGDPKPREGSAPVTESAAESETNRLLRALLAKMDAPPPVSPIAMFGEVAKIMRELAPTPAPPPESNPAAMFEMFNTMLDLRRRVADETEPREDGNGIAAILRDGITPLVGLIREKMEQDKTVHTRQLASGSSNGNGATRRAATSSPPDDPIAKLFARIPQIGRSFLAGAARSKKDPQLYAELVLDQIPAEDYALLPQLLSMQDFVPRMLAVVKEFEPFPVWFTELARAMYASVSASRETVVEVDDLEEVHAEQLEDVHAEAVPSSPGDVHAAAAGAEL